MTKSASRNLALLDISIATSRWQHKPSLPQSPTVMNVSNGFSINGNTAPG